MCLPYALYDWKIRSLSQGSIYVTGRLVCGKEWITSDVVSLEMLSDHYRVQTVNSVYALYW